MNKKYYGDDRYEKIYEQMQLLDIQDVSSPTQDKNGTIVWRLPIKGRGNTHIEYGSFASGYVRNQGNQCHSNWQINTRVESEPQYFELPNGDYRKFTCKTCKLIPIEIDRLEYMMRYVIKNDFIKRAHYNFTKYVHIDTMQASESYYKDKLKRAQENAEFHEKRADELCKTVVEYGVDQYVEWPKKPSKFDNALNEDLLCAMEAQTEGHNVKDVQVIIDGHKYKLI